MKMNLDFKKYRLTSFLVIGSVLLAAVGFSVYPVFASTCGTTYTVQSGDTLGSIATYCGTSLSALEQANTQITDYNLIYPGEVINVSSSVVIPVTGGAGTYTVVAGDFLSSIAAAYGVSLSALEVANPQIT